MYFKHEALVASFNFCFVSSAHSDGRYDDCLKKARETMKMVERAPDDKIQNKPELLASLNSSMGNAYLEKDNTEKALEYHQRDLDIAME